MPQFYHINIKNQGELSGQYLVLVTSIVDGKRLKIRYTGPQGRELIDEGIYLSKSENKHLLQNFVDGIVITL